MIGTTIAHYTITEKIGQGGMGEVYRATDTKLNRDVALKVLPEAFAQDQQRMARFSREAQVLASLNHPNIATIHGLEEADGKQALVLELVEGEDLAERIKKGAIPLEESLKIALQIAEALEAAHEKGVIHRDLKPANVKITPDGVVKVLDFGLAKAMEEEVAPEDISQSPTISQLATKAGIILGTAAYMSPEQAKGKEVDKRTDIWAFGAVLYEMLAGLRAFEGEDATEILASVIKVDIDWEKLPRDTPPVVSRWLRRCLQADPKQRLHDMADFRLGIQEYQADPSTHELDAAVTTPSSGRTQMVPWGVAGLLTAALLISVVVLWPTPPAPRLLARFPIPLPSDQALTSFGRRQVAFSPDGKHLVYVANSQLYLRAIDQLEATPIRGTAEGRGRSPFFSPDGEWVGFYVTGALKKVAITGGAPVTLCGAGSIYGASWGADDRIVFGQASQGIFQVSANGGNKELLISVDSKNNESAHGPQILPGGEAVLFTLAQGRAWDDAQIVVQNLETGERKVLINGGRDVRYAPTGHLVYVQEGTLLAVPFDVTRLEVTGGRVPFVEGIAPGTVSGAAQFAFSDLGSLAYILGGEGGNRTLVWVDREGKEEPLAAEPRRYTWPRISPDGARLAFISRDFEGAHVWTIDLRRNTPAQITFESTDGFPLWTPDGQRIVFTSLREGGGLFWKAADGTGRVERFADGTTGQQAQSFSPDGKKLVFVERSLETSNDLYLLSVEDERASKPLLHESFSENYASISPDGRWMTYSSNESGDNQVYVRPFPNVDDGRWVVSSGRGSRPVWGPQRQELFYLSSPGGDMMMARYKSDPIFEPSNPEVLFPVSSYFSPLGRHYDIHPDGQRFLMIKQSGAAGESGQEIIVVQNWFEELKRQVPTE